MVRRAFKSLMRQFNSIQFNGNWDGQENGTLLSLNSKIFYQMHFQERLSNAGKEVEREAPQVMLLRDCRALTEFEFRVSSIVHAIIYPFIPRI